MSETDLPNEQAAPAAEPGGAPPPAVDEAPAKPHPNVVVIWRITWGIAALVLSGLLLLAALLLGLSLFWAAGPALLMFGLGFHFPRARWRAWSYRVGAADVRLSRGVVWRTHSVVPHARIQHVDTSQGPLDRAFGLAKVVIYTAGSVGAIEAIPGLLHGDAERLRDRLAALSGTEDAL